MRVATRRRAGPITAVILVLLPLLFWAMSPPPARAQEPGLRIFQVSQEDLNDDGRPDLTIIDCSFYTSHDRILVYDGAGDMRYSDDWSQATDFRDDTWIFDAGADGRAKLIIQFSTTADGVQADVYDDEDGDGQVSYVVRSGRATVTESRFPALRITSVPNWTRPDGGLNYNFSIVQYGPLLAEEAESSLLAPYIKRGSNPVSEWLSVDADGDGIPEYYLFRLLATVPKGLAVERAGLLSNEGRVLPKPSSAAVFWPWLGRDPNDSRQNYFATAPTIDYDWGQARVRQAGSVGYPVERGFHINSLRYMLPNVRYVPDFENMMAYYDLANDHDTFPELHIRHRYYEPDDAYGEKVSPALNEIRYSWNQLNQPGLDWDYKLGLAGRHLITSTVAYGDFSLAIVPYEELPRWVTSNTWDFATFVAREGQGYSSSEGIYEWAPIEEKGDDVVNADEAATAGSKRPSAYDYVQGITAEPPRDKFRSIRSGLRGEYSFKYGIRPYLYYSPVDRKLHLLKAEGGIWNVDDNTEVRYANLNGGEYLDQWTYIQRITGPQAITITQQLNVAGSHLLYSGGDEVVIREARAAPSLFETLPPTNNDEWQALGKKLGSGGNSFRPGDFKDMMRQFAGPEATITRAALRDYRPVGADGFRFVLDLQPGFSVSGSAGLNLAGLSPGAYLVSYNGSFAVQPLTPPKLSLKMIALPALDTGPVVDSPVLLQVEASNAGLEDAVGLNLIAATRSGQATQTEIGRQSLDAKSGLPVRAQLNWWPKSGGPTDVRVWLEGPNGEVMAETTERLNVATGKSDAPQALIFLSSADGWRLPALLLLLALPFVTGLIVRMALNSTPWKA